MPIKEVIITQADVKSSISFGFLPTMKQKLNILKFVFDTACRGFLKVSKFRVHSFLQKDIEFIV